MGGGCLWRLHCTYNINPCYKDNLDAGVAIKNCHLLKPVKESTSENNVILEYNITQCRTTHFEKMRSNRVQYYQTSDHVCRHTHLNVFSGTL